MPSQGQQPLSERRDRALEQMKCGHQAFLQSLEGMDPEEAFVGSRWSVWEVLKHLDPVDFEDSLERLVSGEIQALPSFESREERLKRDLDHLEITLQRLRNLFASLSEEQLAGPVTPPNPRNSFPGLTMVQLIESVMHHEATHARQIEATRKFVSEFSAKERAVTFVGLETGDSTLVHASVKELVSYADYIAGTDQALNVVRPWIRGLELTFKENNEQEVLSPIGQGSPKRPVVAGSVLRRPKEIVPRPCRTGPTAL